MDVNMLQHNLPSSEGASINAFGGARPKRPIRGQQYHTSDNAPPQHQSSEPSPSHQSFGPSPSQHDQNKAIANLQRQVSGLAKQFTELMASRTSPKNYADPPIPKSSNYKTNDSSNYRTSGSNNYRGQQSNKPRFYPNPLEYTFDGRPVCLYCKNPGHLKRDCRKKAAADLRRPSGNM